MSGIDEFLYSRSMDGLVPFDVQKEASKGFSMDLREVEDRILTIGLLPMRYARNRKTITPQNQLVLFRSTVAVVGCGGLGGFLVEELLRAGVGNIIVIDPDIFEEHNLNRQIYATMNNLGEPKVAAAALRASEINPAANIIPIQEVLSAENGSELLKKSQLVLDALDSISVRMNLADLCEQLGIPLVHGSVAGWYGQVLTQYPGERIMQKLLGEYSEDRGIEEELGNPSFLPAMVASLEAAEAVKVLLGIGTTLRNRFLSINLFDMEIVEIPILG